jgi:hypothetical protein
MDKKYFIFSVVIITMMCVVTGCISRKEINEKEKQSMIQSKKTRIKNTLSTCFSKSECEIKWAAAKRWVTKDPRRRIKYYTDSFIETEEPPLDSTELAVQIVKEALPQGGYKFVITTKCYHEFGCSPSKWDAEIDFNNYINSGEQGKTVVSDKQPSGIKTKMKDGALKKAEEYKGESKLSLPDLSDKLSLPK